MTGWSAQYARAFHPVPERVAIRAREGREGHRMIYIEIAVAVLAILVTVLPVVGTISRNRIVGVRTRATLANDAA